LRSVFVVARGTGVVRGDLGLLSWGARVSILVGRRGEEGVLLNRDSGKEEVCRWCINDGGARCYEEGKRRESRCRRRSTWKGVTTNRLEEGVGEERCYLEDGDRGGGCWGGGGEDSRNFGG